MYSTDQLVASIRHETAIIKHLHSKLPEGALDWRPTPGQRSTEELLRYLSVGALVPAAYIRDGDWEAAGRIDEEAQRLDLQHFPEAMDRQAERLEEIIRGFSAQELAERDSAMPWGAPCKTGQGLVDMCLKVLVAYRMQLFLYAKQAGNLELGPADCWAGVSMPQG